MTLTARFDDVHMVFPAGLRQPVWALRGLTLDVPAGAVLGLLGPNGAGKTTAISCLLGLLSPQVGTITLWGQRVTSASPVHGARAGVLLEDTRLPPFLTVHAALDTVCVLRGTPDRRRELDRVIGLTRIEDLLGRRVSVLSKGQARRVGVAAALIGDPPLLVLDEPSAGLDASARVEFEALVRSLRGDRTILIASHLFGDVEATCSHLAVISEGRTILEGRADELLETARRGSGSDVHVEASATDELTAIGIAHEPSRYAGLVRIESALPEEELFAALVRIRVVPKRVEPRVSVLSLYLEATKGQES